nr:hypothetical protein [Tanacetum cinerariifolium]
FFIIAVQTPGSGISILLAVGTPSTGSGNLYCQWELSPGNQALYHVLRFYCLFGGLRERLKKFYWLRFGRHEGVLSGGLCSLENFLVVFCLGLSPVFWSRPNGKMIVDSIENGPYIRQMFATPVEPDLYVPVPESFHEQTDKELTENDIKRMDADDQAIQTILLGLPEDKAKLFNEWEKFTSNDGESIESYYHCFMQLMNDLKRNKHFPEKIAANLKFLNNLQPEWKRHVTIVCQTKNLHEADFTQIYDFLKMNQDEDRQIHNVRGNSRNQFGQYAGQVAQNQQGHIAWQNGIANQNGTGNVVTTRAEGIKLQAEEFDFMAAACDLDEIKKVNANCILMANLQHASTSEQYTDLLEPILEPQLVPQNDNHVTYVAPSMVQSGGTVETRSAPNEETQVHKIISHEIAPIINQVDARVQNFEIQFLQEAAKFVRDFKSLAKETDESLNKQKSLELKIERPLKASFSHDIMSIVQNGFVNVPSDLRNELDQCKYDKISYDKAYNDMQQKVKWLQAQLRDLKGKSSDTPSASNTLDLLKQKLESKFIELEFQVVNYEREISHLKTTYKNLFNSITSNRAHAKLHNLIYENAQLRAWVFENTSESMNNTLGMSVTLHVDKPKLSAITPHSKKLYASIPSHSIPQPREFNVVKHRNRHVTFKENVSSDTVNASATGLVHTARIRRPQPKGNTRNAKVSSASKSSDVKKNVTVEDHRRTLLLSKNQKTMSSECNDIKLAIQNDKSEIIYGGTLTSLEIWMVLTYSKEIILQISTPLISMTWPQLLPYVLWPVSKDETSEVIKNFLKKIYVRLQAPVLIVRTDNGTEFKNQVLKEYFDSVGITHETSAAKTPQQNEVIVRINRTLVEAARTIFNKTPFELIQGRKPDISYLYVFGALCYLKNDREDISKLGTKGDIGFFIGYSANSAAYRVYNRRTEKIMDTMNVTFDKLSAMAFEQNSLRPCLQSMTSGQISSELKLTYAPSIITPQRQSERDLDILFEPLYNEYLGGRPNLTPSPSASAADNVLNAMFEGDLFVNPFATPSTESVVSFTQYVDPSNMHSFYQPYPHDYQWTKDHPLEEVIGEPFRPVNQSPSGIFINQSNYVNEILKKYGLNTCDIIGTLMDIKDKLDLDQIGIPVDATKYQADWTSYMLLVMGLWYTKDSGFELTGFLDADYAGCKDTFKSTSDGAQFLGKKLVSWSSKKQDCTSLSTTESEYVSLSACCAQDL